MFRSIRDQYGTTIVIVTHDPKVMSKVDRVVAIRDGKTSTETIRRVAINMTDFAAGIIVLGETPDQFAFLDVAARLPMPRDFRRKLSIKKKVCLELEEHHII